MGAKIISVKNSFREDMTLVLSMIAKGEGFSVWNGYWRDCPPSWVDGPCSLRVKVGKRKRLVKGVLSWESDGWDDGGDMYLWRFTPSRSRVFSLGQRVHQRMKEPRNLSDFLLNHAL